MNEPALKARSHLRSPGFFLFFILVLPPFLHGQPNPRVRLVSFEGVRNFSSLILRGVLATKVGDLLSFSNIESDAREIKRLYSLEGYLFCDAHPNIVYEDDSAAVEVTFVVDEGSPAFLGYVAVEGAQDMGEDIKTALGLVEGEVFLPEQLEAGIQRVLRFCESRGYPLAAVSVQRLTFEPMENADSARLVLSVNLGAMVEISQVRIDGNTTTRKWVIEREIGLSETRFFSANMAEEIKRRLDRLHLFSSVSLPEFYVSGEGKGGILVRVKERNANRFDGVIGYVPGGDGKEGYVTGLVDVAFRNLFGTGRSFATRWIRENQSTQDLALKYSEPWVADLPINAALGFRQRKQDSTYLRRSYEATMSYNVSPELSIGGSFEQTSVYPAVRVNNPVPEGTSTFFGGSIRYDIRDQAVNPTEGAFYSTSYEIGTKSLSRLGRDQVRKAIFDLEYYLSTVPRQVLSTAVHGKDIASTILDQGDLFQIGGTATLRGYRESQFFCSRVVWANVEYRFLTGLRSRVYLFLDAAYIALQNRPSAGLNGFEETRAGYGIGAQVDSGIGIIGFSIGLGQGDSFRSAKLHFRLINEF